MRVPPPTHTNTSPSMALVSANPHECTSPTEPISVWGWSRWHFCRAVRLELAALEHAHSVVVPPEPLRRVCRGARSAVLALLLGIAKVRAEGRFSHVSRCGVTVRRALFDRSSAAVRLSRIPERAREERGGGDEREREYLLYTWQIPIILVPTLSFSISDVLKHHKQMLLSVQTRHEFRKRGRVHVSVW